MHNSGPDLHVANCDYDPGIYCALDDLDNDPVINNLSDWVDIQADECVDCVSVDDQVAEGISVNDDDDDDWVD